MKNIDLFSDYIEEHDEAILSHLYDIKLKYNDAKGMDFTLEFHFSDNDYFTNKVLTKKYTMTCEVSKDDPFSFEGATITEVKGYLIFVL
jgi:nucleosome assembly protein 1-like 1